MIEKVPIAKLKPALKARLDESSLTNIHSMAWLNYMMLLKRLAKLSAEKAQEERSAVIRVYHVRAAAKTVLRSSRG